MAECLFIKGDEVVTRMLGVSQSEVHRIINKLNGESAFDVSCAKEFGFRAGIDDYTHMIRCNPNKGDYSFYIYAYERQIFEKELSPAPHRITVLVIEAGEMPHVKEMNSSPSSLQKEVDGYIQTIYLLEYPVLVSCRSNL